MEYPVLPYLAISQTIPVPLIVYVCASVHADVHSMCGKMLVFLALYTEY